MIGTKTRRNMGRWAQSNTNGRINTGRYAPQINLDLIKSVSSNKIVEIIVRICVTNFWSFSDSISWVCGPNSKRVWRKPPIGAQWNGVQQVYTTAGPRGGFFGPASLHQLWLAAVTVSAQTGNCRCAQTTEPGEPKPPRLIQFSEDFIQQIQCLIAADQMSVCVSVPWIWEFPETRATLYSARCSVRWHKARKQ